MAIIRCSNGHYYNDSDSPNCPYCSGENALGKTIPLDGATANFGGGDAAFPKTQMGNNIPEPSVGTGGFEKTQMLDYQPTAPVSSAVSIPRTEFVSNEEYGSTVFLDSNQNSDIKPVRGWIVAIEGQKCGIDYRIHSGRNTIGRGKGNDICFDFDQTISKDKCCIVTYDERKNNFFVQVGEGTNNIYLNDEILLQPTQLKDNDIIEIGQTKLVFRSLCNESFNY